MDCMRLFTKEDVLDGDEKPVGMGNKVEGDGDGLAVDEGISYNITIIKSRVEPTLCFLSTDVLQV